MIQNLGTVGLGTPVDVLPKGDLPEVKKKQNQKTDLSQDEGKLNNLQDQTQYEKESPDSKTTISPKDFKWTFGKIALVPIVSTLNLVKTLAVVIFYVPTVFVVELTKFVWEVVKATGETILLAITSIFYHVWIDTSLSVKMADNEIGEDVPLLVETRAAPHLLQTTSACSI